MIFAVASPNPAGMAGSPVLRTCFEALAVLVALAFVGGVRWASRRRNTDPATTLTRTALAAIGATAWLTLTGTAAARGVLHFEAPPTMLLAFPAVVALSATLAFSQLGTRLALSLPIAALVGYQGFRVGVELLMHEAYAEGLMPVQMSYTGRNFDIVTGITALLLGGSLIKRGDEWPRRLVFAWNTMGIGLLVNVVVIAILSAPGPMREFMDEPSNVWITHFPWVWLPTVMVLAALTGHLLVYRRLFEERAR